MRRALSIDSIVKRPDARPIDEATVAGLADSIAEVGLINAIRVRDLGGRYEVIAGAHRLAACEKLGLADIECIVVDSDDLHAELAMIDENLCRAELSPSDRARQTARRKAIYEELHPEARHGGAKKDEKFSSFADDTASKVGSTPRIVQIHAERGQKVIDEVLDMVRGTKLDTGAYLDKLKKLTPNEQVTAAKRDLNAEKAKGRPAPIKRSADPLNDFEAVDRQVGALMAAWNKASPEAREQFLGRIDRPVMDRRYGAA